MMVFLRKNFLTICLLLLSPLRADIHAGYSPNPQDLSGPGSPVFTKTNQEGVSWLTLMDQLQYGATWDEGGALLKDVITRPQWIAAMKAIRRPLGYVSARKLVNQELLKGLPNGTKGEFVKMRFQTSFQAKSSATETLLLMPNVRGDWLVISYEVH